MQKTGDRGELELLKTVLKKTFSKIKQDITLNSDKLESNSKNINKLNTEISTLSKELKQIKSLLKTMNSSLKKISSQSKTPTINQQQPIQQPIQQSMQKQIQQPMQQQIQRPIQHSNRGLQTEIMRRLKRNKKPVIKQKILNVISSGQYTLPEIKDIIVDENNYCSKASFYRYFEELKKRNLIDIIDINDVKIIVIKSQTSIRL